jgi:multidrug resistance protein
MSYAGTVTGGEAAPERGLPYPWKVLISVIFGIFMVILDATVVNVALRTLQEEFSSKVNDAQWIISLYVMALGIATPLSGYLGDRFGEKRVFLAGIGLFAFGSFLCGVAPGLWFLVAARALQGMGGGIALPIGTALLFNAFRPEERGKALGIFGIALVVAPALGPILGGWLVDAGHWRWIFFLNVPVGIVGVALGAAWLRPRTPGRIPRFDLPGLVTAALGFGLVLYAASIAANVGWTDRRVVASFIVGGVALGLTIQTTLTTALAVVEPRQTARASALSNATRQVVQSLAVAVLATILTSALAPGLSAQLERFQQAAPNAAVGSPRFELCAAQPAPGALPPQAVPLVRQFCGEYITGLGDAYRVTFVAALLALVLGAFLPGWPGRWAGRARAADPPGAREAAAVGK